MSAKGFRSRLSTISLVCILGSLTGCSSAVHLHDAGKAATAKEANDTYKAAEVGKVVDVEQTNLNALLQEELKVVRATRQLRFEMELLRMAADETAPMARSLVEATSRLKSLGFDDAAAARQFLIHRVAQDSYEEFMHDGQVRARLAGGPRFPACPKSGPLPELKPDDLKDLTALQKAAVKREFDKYKTRCDQFQKNNQVLTGALNDQQLAITQAELDVLALRAEIKRGHGAESDLNKEFAAAKKAGEAPEIAAAIAKHAKSASEKLGAGIKALGTLGLEHPAFEKIDAIQTVLRAVADGSVAEDVAADGDLLRKANIAKEIPGLVEDMTDLIAKARAPSVSNLLIALNHQKILIAGDEARLLLAQQRVDLLQQQYNAMLGEVRAIRDLHDHLCTFATRLAGGRHPGQACDAFRVTMTANPAGGPATVTCTGVDGNALPDCALAGPWREALAVSGRDAATRAAKRALDEAIADIAFAHDARTHAIEIDYRLIDLDHREAVAANRLALDAWNNLIAVPVEQIAGYHASGIKPEEIAQLIVQALGFSAITTGILADD